MEVKIYKNKAAQTLGKLGGLATKKKGSEYFKRISKLGVEARRVKQGRCTKCGELLISDEDSLCGNCV